MGLLDRLRGDAAPAPEEVARRLRAVWEGVPGVAVEEVDYRTERYHQGAVHALLVVPDAATLAVALRAAHAAAPDLLGRRADGVGWDVVGRLPDGGAVTPADLGLPARPTGAELARWAPGDTPDTSGGGEVKS